MWNGSVPIQEKTHATQFASHGSRYSRQGFVWDFFGKFVAQVEFGGQSIGDRPTQVGLLPSGVENIGPESVWIAPASRKVEFAATQEIESIA